MVTFTRLKNATRVAFFFIDEGIIRVADVRSPFLLTPHHNKRKMLIKSLQISLLAVPNISHKLFLVAIANLLLLTSSLFLASCSGNRNVPIADNNVLATQNTEESEATAASPANTKNNTLVANSSDYFVLPSGNIYCALVGANREFLRCEIRSLLNPMPPQSDNCEFDWGNGFLLSQNSKPEILCISDTIAGSYPTLAYDTTWKNSGFECLSETRGLTCKNSAGQGFFLSRERWAIF